MSEGIEKCIRTIESKSNGALIDHYGLNLNILTRKVMKVEETSKLSKEYLKIFNIICCRWPVKVFHFIISLFRRTLFYSWYVVWQADNEIKIHLASN